MFNQYEPNVKAVIVFLKLLGVKVTNTTVDETLQNHPDYPGLLSISDSLSRWNVPNAALKINLSQIDELESPFIAYVNNELQPVSIVTSVDMVTSLVPTIKPKPIFYLNSEKMKKYEYLGKSLSREEQKSIGGGLTQVANTVCICLGGENRCNMR
ncbi:MAG: hypothetical protein M0Q26_01280 [Chitinophagaceae bacterium]|nr:hypothetical protein [Chitinophagaceae bacterium]